MALLVKRLDVNVDDVPNVIVVGCTLHNICDTHLMKVWRVLRHHVTQLLKMIDIISVVVWSKINVHRALMTLSVSLIVLYHIIVYYVQSDCLIRRKCLNHLLLDTSCTHVSK